MNRRTYLQWSATAVTGTALASGSAAATTRHGLTFDRVVNAVDDLGMDPNGNDPIDATLDANIESGTLIEFPPGDYRLTQRHDVSVTNFGIRGTGSSRGDVRFFPDSGQGFYAFRFPKDAQPTGVLFENFTLDRLDDYDTSLGMKGAVQDGLEIHDVEYDGWTPSGPQMLVLAITDSSGSATIDGFYRTGPTRFERYPDSSIDILVTNSSVGEVNMRDIRIHNGSESGVYASKSQGRVTLEDSYFKNVVHTAVRVAGANSHVKNTTIVMDTEDWHPDNEKVESTYNDGEKIQLNRAIWPQTNTHQKTGPLVENCDIVIENCPQGIGGIVVPSDCGGARVRDTRIECNEPEVKAVLASSVDTNEAGEPYEMVLDGVSVTGSGSEEAGIWIRGRDGSTVKNSCLDLDRSGQDGIKFTDSANCTVENTNVDVSGTQVVEDNSTVTTSGITTGETCPVAGSGGGSALSYDGDATAVDVSHDSDDERSGVEFSITNGANSDLTLTEVAVTPADASIDGLHDESSEVGKWVSELHVEADVQTGVTDVSVGASLPRTFDMDADGWDDAADDNAILSSGSSATVALSRFESGDTPVDMVGESVDVELGYTLGDGTTGAQTFTLDVASSGPALAYDGDATAVDVSHDSSSAKCGVEFSLTNESGSELTMTEMTVTPANTSIDGLHDESSEVGKWVSELHVEADVQNGVTDVSAGASLPRTFDMDADGWDDAADDNAILSNGAVATVALARFESSDTPVDMVGESVDVSVAYTTADGDSGTVEFTLQP